jgi:hypothetical protein
MAERSRTTAKRPDEILDNVFEGHKEALFAGSESGKKYLLNYLKQYNSIPNAVKFYIYDLLAEDSYQAGDTELCRQAVESAREYLEDAKVENSRRLAEYLNELRFIERGISIMVDAGEFAKAISLCDLGIESGLGKVYLAKKASIERLI